MTKVKVLIEGWTNTGKGVDEEKEGHLATTTLILDGDIRAIVDPGVESEPGTILEALKREGLQPKEITHVFLTHSHYDHYANVGYFLKNAKVVEYWGEWRGNRAFRKEYQYGNIEIIKTPGHSDDSLTFLVSTDMGRIAIVGDVWWYEGSPEFDKYANKNEVLGESRKKIWELADFVVPGHGGIYKVGK